MHRRKFLATAELSALAFSEEERRYGSHRAPRQVGNRVPILTLEEKSRGIHCTPFTVSV
jgi:hypothetical protein